MGKSKDDGKKNPLDLTGERLRSVAEALYDGNKSALARSLEMQPSSFAKYIDGQRRPGAVVLAKLARQGVNLNWLLQGSGPMLDTNGPTSSDESSASNGSNPVSVEPPGTNHTLYGIPLVRIRETEDNEVRLLKTGIAEWVPGSFVRKHYGVRPGRLRDFKISGDSMTHTVVPGDRVRAVTWNGHHPEEGAICIVRSPISVLVRRVRVREDTLSLEADNPDVEDHVIDHEQWENEYEPIARVIEVRRML